MNFTEQEIIMGSRFNRLNPKTAFYTCKVFFEAMRFLENLDYSHIRAIDIQIAETYLHTLLSANGFNAWSYMQSYSAITRLESLSKFSDLINAIYKSLAKSS